MKKGIQKTLVVGAAFMATMNFNSCAYGPAMNYNAGAYGPAMDYDSIEYFNNSESDEAIQDTAEKTEKKHIIEIIPLEDKVETVSDNDASKASEENDEDTDETDQESSEVEDESIGKTTEADK